MATNVNYLTVSVKDQSANIHSSGLKVSQVVDADTLSAVEGILFSVQGEGLFYDSSNDTVLLITSEGFQVTLTRKGDWFQWLPGPEDLGGAATSPGSTVDKTCQIVWERNASGVRTRMASRDFTVTLERQYGFTPQQISGLKGWWDAYSLTEAVAAVVTTWADKTLFDRDLTEATNKPTRQNTEAGRPYLDFDGTNDVLTSTLADIGTACTVFVVASIDSYDATVRGIVQVGGTNGARIAFDNANLKGISGSDVAAGTLPSLDTWFAACATKTASGAITIQKGTGSVTTQASTAAVTAGTVSVGDTAADSFADVRIAEVIVYDSVLSTDNREKVLRYLMAKWNAQG